MIGVRTMEHEDGREVLRIARGVHLGQAGDKDYRRAVEQAESALGLR